MTRNDRYIGLSIAAVTAALLTVGGTAAEALAGKKQAPAAEATPGSTLEEAGLRFESARLLSDADRSAGLEDALQITNRALQHGTEDEKAAARFLSGEIRCGLGHYGEAADEFSRAEGAFRKTPFADDAAFAAIQAMEANGKDA